MAYPGWGSAWNQPPRYYGRPSSYGPGARPNAAGMGYRPYATGQGRAQAPSGFGQAGGYPAGQPSAGRAATPYAGNGGQQATPSAGRPSAPYGTRQASSPAGRPAGSYAGRTATPYGGRPAQAFDGRPAAPSGASGFRPAQAASQPRPSSTVMHNAKDVKNVTDEQATAKTQVAQEAEPEPEVVEAEVLEPVAEQPEPQTQGELDAELEAAAGEAVAAAIEESELVAKAQAEAADWKDKYLRLHAEWDTYRRRMKEQSATDKALANEKIVASLLPVIDDFERTITYATDNGETGLLGGVQAVYAKLLDTLKKDGVEVIDPVGQPFDALECQAVATVDNPDVPDETVNQVYQKGFRMGSKVLRPAMVTVTTGGPAREKPADAAE